MQIVFQATIIIYQHFVLVLFKLHTVFLSPINAFFPMDSRVFQEPTECWECLALGGCKERSEEMELKDRLVTRVRKECWDQR